MNETRIVKGLSIPWYEYTEKCFALRGYKYITCKVYTRIITFIFPPYYTHNEMYYRRFEGKGIISAGFIDVSKDKKVTAYGRSTSITGKPSATDTDTKAIEAFLKGKENERIS